MLPLRGSPVSMTLADSKAREILGKVAYHRQAIPTKNVHQKKVTSINRFLFRFWNPRDAMA
ncbi:hypothetical protein P5673_017304 [Acropora cervicornis]|uniref:Uncharacterized protein n=1 Tax=Acropora cervicornis TaxID=6130 RepID=A0AAD9QG88_ACRCE|nr:hypothetical protein P5673_017304 [Acropora cervicornis]